MEMVQISKDSVKSEENLGTTLEEGGFLPPIPLCRGNPLTDFGIRKIKGSGQLYRPLEPALHVLGENLGKVPRLNPDRPL